MKPSRLCRLLRNQHAEDGLQKRNGSLVADAADASSESSDDNKDTMLETDKYATFSQGAADDTSAGPAAAAGATVAVSSTTYLPKMGSSNGHGPYLLVAGVGNGGLHPSESSSGLLVRRNQQQRDLDTPSTSTDGNRDEDGSGSAGGGSMRDVTLKRRVGLLSGVALIVGTMIGSGIFVSPGQLLQRTGSVSMSLFVWVACGILSLLGGMAYGELGTMLPYAGGEYSYYLAAFGGFPGFMYCWVSVIILKPAMMGIVCLTFSSYAVKGFLSSCNQHVDVDVDVNGVDGDTGAASKLLGVLTIALVTFINCYNVKLATAVQNFFTAAKLLAIGIIICGGLWMIAQGHHENLAWDIEKSGEIGQLASAFYSGLWAYDGWNNLNYVTEEIENPYVNLPRAIVLALPLVIVCYLLVNVAYLSVMTSVQIAESSAVAVEFGEIVLGRFAWIMPLAVVLSTFGAANGTEFTAGRLAYSAARERHMVDFLSYVNVRSHAPSPALIFNGVMATAMIAAGDIGSLIDFFSFTAWIFYGGAMLALIVMRRTKRDLPRPYKVNIIIPIIVALISIYLVIGPIVDAPKVEYLYALAFIAMGAFVYIPFVRYRFVLPGIASQFSLNSCSRWFQPTAEESLRYDRPLASYRRNFRLLT